ncbi:hypothetical protein M3Y97_00471000 [Aphelenchoides bicaudatus]|nr:hypothetical protein M3Y97_00471000 [Aphelenchoides bicaudatus]
MTMKNGSVVGAAKPDKANGVKANGVAKANGLAPPPFGNSLQVPSTSNGMATTAINMEAFVQPLPIQIKRPPFAFRILNQLNALMGRKNEHFDLAYTSASTDTTAIDPMKFQQSVTRNLAFPSTSSFASVKEKKQKNLGEFYNNSTLTLVAKLFSICVIMLAICMIIRELFYGKSK